MAKSKKQIPTRQLSNKRGRSSSSRRSVAGSVTSTATPQEVEDTFQVMLDLMATPIDLNDFKCSSGSSDSSSGKLTPCSSNGSGAGFLNPTTPNANKRRLSPNSPTNYLQISHDGKVKTHAFAARSPTKSAFVPVAAAAAPSSPDAAAGGPVKVFAAIPPKQIHSSSPQSPGREPPGRYSKENSSCLDVVMEYSAHSHSLRDMPSQRQQQRTTASSSSHHSSRRSNHSDHEKDKKQSSSKHSRLSFKRKGKQVSFAIHEDDDSTIPPPKGPSCWRLLSPHLFFLVGCCLYVGVSFMNVEYFVHHQDIPTAILYADDDAIWWDWYNQTLGIPISQADWESNNRPFLDDDNVASLQIADKNVDVTKYQLVALAAAICFWVTGLLHVCLQKSRWIKATYGVMVVAAGLGVASALLLEYNGYWATVLYAASVHLFAAQAIALVVIHSSGDDEQENDNVKSKDTRGDKETQHKDNASGKEASTGTAASTKDRIVWSLVGDVCFLVGTLIDVFLSYFRINESAGVSHAYASVAAAAFWLVSSVLYLSVAAQSYRSLLNNDHDDGGDSSISSQESNEKNKTALEFGSDDDENDPQAAKAWLLKGTPLADKMDDENSIVSGKAAPFDEAHSLEL